MTRNTKHALAIFIGLTYCRWTGYRFGGRPLSFPHVVANLAADGLIVWCPYR